MSLLRIAVLDDYQGVALELADWSGVMERAEVTVFRDHLFEANDVVARLQAFDVVCLMRERTPVTRAMLEQLPNLKLMVTTGMRNASLDMAAAAERGIPVLGTRSAANGTVELAWALMLALVKHLPEETAGMKAGKWQLAVGGDLEGRTLGVVGLGRIGAKVAQVGKAFGMDVIAWSQNLTAEAAEKEGARLVTKEQLFREADLVTIHMVLSERTKGLVGAAELALMKPTAYVVNTSRAGLLDMEALLAALERKQIAGAGVDVFETEPLPLDSPLRNTERLLVTPHVGFVNEGGYRIFYGEMVQDLISWFEGKPVRVLNGPGGSGVAH